MKIINTEIENDPISVNLVSLSTIYSALEGCDRDTFIQKGYIAQFDVGEFLIKEGEIGDKFFIIRSGSVEVFTESAGHKISLSILSNGACIGEGSLITKCRRTANVQCVTDVTALVFNYLDIEHIIEKNPKLKALLVALIEQRAKSAAKKILSVVD